MKLEKQKKVYTDVDGVDHNYYELALILDNGDRVPIKPLFKNDKGKLTGNAYFKEKGGKN